MKMYAIKRTLAAATCCFAMVFCGHADIVVSAAAAQQRNPWSGLVDIVVTIQGESNDVAEAECAFVATNTATQSAISVRHITRNGDDTGSGNVWTRKYIWDARADVGAVKVDDVALSVDAFVGVQLWENGPYWATCNVGATKPEECGYYFWWGDTVGYKRLDDQWVSVDGSRTCFSFYNCPTVNKDNLQLLTEGFTDATGNLVSAYDAATANLGSPWRMPTDADFASLIKSCSITRVTRNGACGWLVTGSGEYSSKSIFIPAAGYGDNTELEVFGSVGNVWSSTPYSGSFSYACFLDFFGSSVSRCSDSRSGGRSVRPVRGVAELGNAGDGVSVHLALDCTWADKIIVSSVTAQQRDPYSGLVDIAVTIRGESNDVAEAECAFVATNVATQLAIPVEHITRNGEDSGSGNVWTRKFVWDSFADVGAVKMDDVLLAADAKVLGGVQLWEDGPYWAECNVGATRPEEYGYYFYWGDTVGYILGDVGWDAFDGSQIEFSFSSKNCPAYGKSAQQLQSEGYIDAAGNIMPEYDAATAHSGGPWRMPTKDELSLLLNNCDAEWTASNGVYGLCVKGRGKYSSRSVFIPAASSGHFSSCEYPGSDGYLWSSTWDLNSGFHAWCLAFASSSVVVMQRSVDYGQSVRPVRSKGAAGKVDKGVETHLALDCTLVGKVIVTSVSARQRYPWNGLVDVTVTLQGEGADLLVTECAFAATNNATKEEVLVEHITRNGEDSGSGNVLTRKYVWDAKADVGAVKIDDVVLSVGTKPFGVQLWVNGPCWAECNVGATRPEEYGYYFWWGDSVGYKRNESNNGWIAVEEQKDNLKDAHDAATTHLGAPWRMPTDAEFSALISNCTTAWTTRNGVFGRLVTGKGAYASKSIFLPAAGYGVGSSIYRLGSGGFYWSSTPNSSDSSLACGLYFFSDDFYRGDYGDCDSWKSVRPVRAFVDGAWSGSSTAMTNLQLDCRTGARVADCSQPLVYDASWYDGGVLAKIMANGDEIVSGAMGMYAWVPQKDGVYFLALNAYDAEGEVVGTEGVWCLSREDLTELVIPDGTTEIGEYAFAGGQFTSVTIPNSVTNVAPTAFAGCLNIVEVSVTSGAQIPNLSDLFPDSLSGIERATVGSRDGTIHANFLAGCESLKSLVIADDVKRIEAGSFDDCVALESVVFPSELEDFGLELIPEAMRKSLGLAYDADGFMIYNGWLLDYDDDYVMEMTVPEGVVGIGHWALADLYDLETVRLPSTLKYIASVAFARDSYLDEVEIPDSVVRIGDGAFEDCSWMRTISIGRGVESVGSRAFAGCTKLSMVHFEDGLTEVGDCAFSNCWRMLSVSLPMSVTNVGTTAFKECDSLTGVTVPSGIASLSKWFAPVYRQIKNATIPSGETLICSNMFKGCSALVSAVVPEGVTNIGDCAFEDCVCLPSIVLPSSLRSVGESAFRNCDMLTAVGLPDAISSVGAYAFYDCYRLKDVSLPKNLESLSDYVFDACPQLDSIYVPASVTQLGSHVFGGAMSAVYFIGNAPAYDADVYASTDDGLVTYVKYGTKGWDGRPNSRDLPKKWPTDSTYGRSITTWDPVQFVVTFDAGEGVFYPIGSQTYSCEQIMYTAYTLPPFNPVRNGYKFAGWWTEAIGGAEITPSTGVKLDRPHTLYAHWNEISQPIVIGDEGATVTGDAESGFVIKPSVGITSVEVTIPLGVDAAKVTVEVTPKVASVKPNGAKVKVIVGEGDITNFLVIPESDGVLNIAAATVKEEIVKETLDPSKDAVIELNAANPRLTTAPTRKGLTYTLYEGQELKSLSKGDSKLGDGNSWTPTITVSGGNAAFYSIDVTK